MSENKVFKEYSLEQEQELRFEVKSRRVYLTLKSGFAEIFGSDLLIGETYEFTAGARIAVFTGDGCVLQVNGETDVIHISKETPMDIYSNCHIHLEFMRMKAIREDKRGPIAMIVGPRDVGKSTLSRLLLNYAVRMGRRPIFVDLDVELGEIAIPGTIGAVVVDRHAPVGEGFSMDAPVVYNFGHKSPQANTTLFNVLVNKLATTVRGLLSEAHKETKTTGVIINTCGWTRSDGYKQLLATANAFEVEFIMVLDQKRLYEELVRDLPSSVLIVSLPKSDGVVERSKNTRVVASNRRTISYFGGTTSYQLFPYLFNVNFSDVEIYEIGDSTLLDPSLPIGMQIDDHMTRVVPLEPDTGLLNHILAISYAEDVEEVVTSHVAGFVLVLSVDAEKQILTLLSPQPQLLPFRILVLSEIQECDIDGM